MKKILFDHGTPAPLRAFLKDHTVHEARHEGWDRLHNGALLDAAEEAGFDILLTTDKRMVYQQNLTGRKIAILVLGTSQWPDLRPHVDWVVTAVNEAGPGSYKVVEVPDTQ